MGLPNDFDAFAESLRADQPPAAWPEGLRALWYDGKGDWEAAHQLAQDMPGTTGSWIHAYLHRKEGDRWNAGYWYDRAGRPFPTLTLEEEFQAMVRLLLEQG